MQEKFLPVGSVVLLKGASKRLMITGFCSMDSSEENAELFDYSGCLYPEGVLSTDETALFNHDQIERIDFVGFSDAEDKSFKIKLNEYLKENSIETAAPTNVEVPKVDVKSVPPVGPGLAGYVAPVQTVSSPVNSQTVSVPPVGPGLAGYVPPVQSASTDTEQSGSIESFNF